MSGLSAMSGLSTVLRKTAFKLILISYLYFDTSKCRPRGDQGSLSRPVTVTVRLSFSFFPFLPLPFRYAELLNNIPKPVRSVMKGTSTEEDLLKREIEDLPVVSSVK